MPRKIFIFILSITLFLFIGLTSAIAQQNPPEEALEPGQHIRARVLEVQTIQETQSLTGALGEGKEQLITVELLKSPYQGQKIQVNNIITNHPGYDIIVQPGDEVILYVESEGDTIQTAYIENYARDKKLIQITGLFIILLIGIGGKKGIKSVISLSITGGAIFLVLLPLTFQGYNPIIIAVLVSAAVTAITLSMIGGISIKTLSAIIGTTGGVLVAGILAITFGKAAHLTGFSSEEMNMLLYIPQQIKFNCQGILFAGMIVGALGAVMDVGMSIASAIEEIKKANPNLRAGSLIRAGMNVGQDIMGTMANTLILAYTGGAIPLMLIFMAYDTPLLKVVNLDLIATEVIRALAGSIGLILAIPITSITAGLFISQSKQFSSLDTHEDATINF